MSSAVNLAEYVNQRQPVTTTTIAVQPSVATIAMDPAPTVNPKIASASSSLCDEDAEGMEGGMGSTATLNPNVPSMTASRSGNMTAIVDAEQLAMEQWIAEKERNDRESVRKWLEIVGYGQYVDILANNGLGRMREIERVQSQDELQAIGIMDIDDRMGLVAAIRDLRQ